MPSTLLPIVLIDESILILISQLLHCCNTYLSVSTDSFQVLYTIKQVCQITVPAAAIAAEQQLLMLCSEVIFVLFTLDDCDEGHGQPATTIAVCFEKYDECDPPPNL